MANVTGGHYRDLRTPGVNEVRMQYRNYVVQGGNMTSSDTLEFTLEDAANEGGMPVVGVILWSHNGGMDTPATATHVTSDGDTIVFQFHYPQNQKSTGLHDEDTPTYTDIVHTLAGVTGGAATAAELVASINGDTELRKWGFAAVTATNVVTVFPIGPDSHVRIGNGSTSVVAAAFGAAVFNNARTLTMVGADEATLVYTPADKKVVIGKTGATVAKVEASVVAH